MFVLFVKLFKYFKHKRQTVIDMKVHNKGHCNNTFVSIFILTIQICTVVISFICLSALRILFRDVLLPIYYIALIFESLQNNQAITMAIHIQSSFYDLTDFLTGISMLYLFYYYGKPQKKKGRRRPRNYTMMYQ